MTYEYECTHCSALSEFDITPEVEPITGLAPHRCEPGGRWEVEGPELCDCGHWFENKKVFAEWKKSLRNSDE